MAPKIRLLPDAKIINERKALRALSVLMEALADAELVNQNGKKLVAVNAGKWNAWLNAWGNK